MFSPLEYLKFKLYVYFELGEKMHLIDKPDFSVHGVVNSSSAHHLIDEVWSLKATNGFHSACEPNYQEFPGEELRPTEKMIQFEQQALEALNSSVASKLPASTVQERQLGTALSERAVTLDGNFPETYPEVLNELAKVHDLFAGLDLQSTQKIIMEANRTLEPLRKRIAISKSGEIWLGHKNFSSGQYSLVMPLKEAECDVS